MVRTQITLTESQMAALRDVAGRRRQSIAAVVREAVDEALRQDVQRRRIDRAVEAVRDNPQGSGLTDIARNHDDYLTEDLSG